MTELKYLENLTEVNLNSFIVAEEFNSLPVTNLISYCIKATFKTRGFGFFLSVCACEMPEKLADLQPKHFQIVPKDARVFQSNFPQLNSEMSK